VKLGHLAPQDKVKVEEMGILDKSVAWPLATIRLGPVFMS